MIWLNFFWAASAARQHGYWARCAAIRDGSWLNKSHSLACLCSSAYWGAKSSTGIGAEGWPSPEELAVHPRWLESHLRVPELKGGMIISQACKLMYEAAKAAMGSQLARMLHNCCHCFSNSTVMIGMSSSTLCQIQNLLQAAYLGGQASNYTAILISTG